MSNIDLNRLIRTLEPALRVGLEAAASLAARDRHANVDVAHWILSLLDISEVSSLFEELSVSSAALRTELDSAIADLPRGDGAALVLSQNLLALMREAWLVASLQCGRSSITFADLLTALSDDQSLRIMARGMAPSLRSLDRNALEKKLNATFASDGASSLSENSETVAAVGENEFLRLDKRDMTADARLGPVSGLTGTGPGGLPPDA